MSNLFTFFYFYFEGFVFIIPPQRVKLLLQGLATKLIFASVRCYLEDKTIFFIAMIYFHCSQESVIFSPSSFKESIKEWQTLFV